MRNLIAEAGVHQLLLAPFGVSPIHDGVDAGPLLCVTDSATALIVQTGCADGPVVLTVRLYDGEPAGVAETDLRAAWEVQESVSLDVVGPLHLSSPSWTDLFEPVLTPEQPGPHRIRVSARGRGEHYDESVFEATEHYLVEAWPEPSRRPRELARDDHAWS